MTIRTIMSNPLILLTVQTALVSNLKHLSGIPGTGKAVTLASTAECQCAEALLNRLAL